MRLRDHETGRVMEVRPQQALRLFAIHNPVTHCAPKRLRRTWGATVLTVLTGLALAALTGWLLWIVKATLEVGVGVAPGTGLAVAPLQMVVVALVDHWWAMLAVGVLLAVVVGLAEAKHADNEIKAHQQRVEALKREALRRVQARRAQSLKKGGRDHE